MLAMTSSPRAFSFTLEINCFVTLKLTSASSSAIRTSRNDSETLVSEIFPSPRRFLKVFCSFSLRDSNMGEEDKYGLEV